MDDILAFINARLDEDEAVAKALVVPAHDKHMPHPELSEWSYDGDEVFYTPTPEMLEQKYYSRWNVTQDGEGLLPSVDEDEGAHIARHDPARVLRQVAALRVVVEHSLQSMATVDGEWGCCHSAEEIAKGNCLYEKPDKDEGIRAIASIWSGHETYRQEWSQ